MSFNGIKQVVDAELEGRYRISEFFKTPNQVTTAGIWYDLTGSGTNQPKAKQWFDATPLVAQQISHTADGGIFHGKAVSPYQKVIRKLRIGSNSATGLPMGIYLMDYLLYYPSIEDGNTDLQEMDNTLTLPRYTDGEGVMVMAVTISSRTGGQKFYFTYTNSDGVSGRVSQTVTQNTAAAPGSVTTSATATAGSSGPFIGLQAGDRGVRSIESVQMLGADTGFFALVLVKPLVFTQLWEQGIVYDKDLLLLEGDLPVVEDDAYLSLLACPNGSLSGVTIKGNLKVVWN